MKHMIRPRIEQVDLVELAKKIPNPKEKPRRPTRRKQETQQQTEPTEIKTQAQITKSDYIQHPQYKILVPKFEQAEFKGFNWENTHYKTQESGLIMPTPLHLMTHFLNIIKAKQGKLTLFDGNSNPIPKKEIDDIYKHFTTDHINGGAWSHLDALFTINSEERYITTNHRVKIDPNGGKSLQGTKFPLEDCLEAVCLATLSINSQGLLTTKSKAKSYRAGRNIFFYSPLNNTIARFVAEAYRANLDCDGYPQFSDSSLGVFACAASTAPEN